MYLYIYSGIEPSKKGAGKFLQYFLSLLDKSEKSYKLFYVRTPENRVINFLKKTPFFNILKTAYYRVSQFKRQQLPKNSTVIIFHPQALGLKQTIKLIEENAHIYYYVLDNFFFCIKSYNHRTGFKACHLCLDDAHAGEKKYCKSFPNQINYDTYFEFQAVLKSNQQKITYLTQNKQQSSLVETFFGKGVSINQIGMHTNEIVNGGEKESWPLKYDCVYHNTLLEVKGLIYFLELSKTLPHKSFVIPFEREQVKQVYKKSLPDNVFTIPCNWETGLQDLVRQSHITLVPSLWSAPIEGSLLKSLYDANTVAVVPDSYSFAHELPQNICLKLPQEIIAAKNILEKVWLEKITLKREARIWCEQFFNQNKLSLQEFINEL